MNWLKRLFCKHIWELKEKRYLYTTETIMFGVPYKTKQHYVETNVCVLCGKKKIEETTLSTYMTREESLDAYRKLHRWDK